MFCVFWRLGVAIEVPGTVLTFVLTVDGCVFCPARFIETLGARRGTRYPFRGVQEGRRTRPETREPGEEPGRTAWKLESAGPATAARRIAFCFFLRSSQYAAPGSPRHEL